MDKVFKIKRERIAPEEFEDMMDEIELSHEEFRDLFNRGYSEIQGYATGLRGDGSPHNPPTVAETLVLDVLIAKPELVDEFLEIARSRMEDSA